MAMELAASELDSSVAPTAEQPEPTSEADAAGAGAGGGALRDALRGLADESGLVTAEGLRRVAGFDENAAAALEARVGCGPWRVGELEALLGALFDSCAGGGAGGPGSGCDSGPATPTKQGSPGGWGCGSELDAGASHTPWRTVELKELEDIVDAAVHAEEFTISHELDEPESEHTTEDLEAVEEGLRKVQQSVMQRIVEPIVGGSSPVEEEERALRQLPALVEELLTVLRKTWHLAKIRGLQAQHTGRELDAARSEARALAERAAREEAARLAAESEAGQGEKAHELLEGTMSKLSAARKSVKERESELIEARQRIEQLERERTAQDRRVQQLDSLLRQETEARSEAERQIAEARSDADAEAAEQRGALRRRLAVVEAEMQRVAEERDGAELRCDELRACGDRRSLELEARLAESQRIIELLEQRLAHHRAPGAAPGPDDLVSPGATSSGGSAGQTKEIAAQDAASDVAGRLARSRRSISAAFTAVAGTAAGGPLAPGAAAGAAKDKQSQRRLSDELHEETVRKAQLKNGRQPAQPSVAQSMPMDLRSLGKLLSGSGALHRRKNGKEESATAPALFDRHAKPPSSIS